jgi:hypothetical protein
MPLRNGRLVLERQVSDFAERFTVDPNNLLSVGTFVGLATSGNYELAITTGSGDNKAIGVIYALDRSSNPFVALKGRCIVNTRGVVAKGDTLILSSSKGKLTANNGAAFELVKAIAISTTNEEHGQVEAVLV